MSQSASIAKLAAALVAVQGQLRGYAEDSDNPFFKSKYGDLTSVWAAIREPLAVNELAVIQTLGVCDNPLDVEVSTTLVHISGEWIAGTVRLRAVKEGPQSIGSAITYARRYGLAAIVGVAPADDDGEGATDHGTKRKAKQRTAQKKADTAARPASRPPSTSGPDRLSQLRARATTGGMNQDTWTRLCQGVGITQGTRDDSAKLDALAGEVTNWERATIDNAQRDPDQPSTDQPEVPHSEGPTPLDPPDDPGPPEFESPAPPPTEPPGVSSYAELKHWALDQDGMPLATFTALCEECQVTNRTQSRDKLRELGDKIDVWVQGSRE